jgi:hypothetical protein
MAEKGLNLRIQEFEEDVAKAVEKAKLPPKLLTYIFADYTNQMKAASVSAVAIERKAFAEAEKGEEPDGQSVQ